MVHLQVVPGGRFVLVVARGLLDEAGIPALRHDLLAVLSQHPADVVLDLTELAGLGVRGQAVLIGLRLRLRARGRHLVLVTAAHSTSDTSDEDTTYGGSDAFFQRPSVPGAERLLAALDGSRR